MSKAPKSSTTSIHSNAISEFYTVVNDALWTIYLFPFCHLDALEWGKVDAAVLNEDHFEKFRQRSIRKSAETLDKLKEQLDEYAALVHDPLIKYVKFRTIGRHVSIPKFKDDTYLTNVDLASEITVIFLHWLMELEYLFKTSTYGGSYILGEERSPVKMHEFPRVLREHHSNLKATGAELEVLMARVTQEHSWAEEIVQQKPEIPEEATTDGDGETRYRAVQIARFLKVEKSTLCSWRTRAPNAYPREAIALATDWRKFVSAVWPDKKYNPESIPLE